MTSPGQRVRGALRGLVPLTLGLLAGWMLWGGGDAGDPAPHGSADAAAAAETELWTCSMHPRIRLPRPGACPICGMDLVRVEARGGTDTGPTLELSPAQRERMRIRTVPVERRYPEARIRLAGRVDYDETRVSRVTAWFPGRIERLYVDYTGVRVAEGDHVAYVYSPEVYAAQEELLQAKRAADRLGAGSAGGPGDASLDTYEAARERLLQWGLGEAQVDALVERGVADSHVTIYSPAGGLVIERSVREGVYVETGTPLVTVADLARVWVQLEAYESDLAWLRFGQHLSFETEAWPGRVFEGTISFIDPVLDPRTRTVRVRVTADNADGLLKPEMFVRATVRARVAASGRVMDPSLLGKWVSPMHPEIVEDGPGACDVCGMDLVPAETLGYVPAEGLASDVPLVVPVTAVLVTGRRAVVYVERTDTEVPTYEGREVVLGPRAGDDYVVEGGLAEGELVVAQGGFKLDSELQIRAQPSMMSAPSEPRDGASHAGAGAEHGHAPLPSDLELDLDALWASYLELHTRLAGDDPEGAARAAASARSELDAIAATAPEGEAADAWSQLRRELDAPLATAAATEDLAEQRAAFQALSTALAELLIRSDADALDEALRVECPMAFGGSGGTWLQASDEVQNPYFGDAMPACGEVLGRLVEPAADGGER